MDSSLHRPEPPARGRLRTILSAVREAVVGSRQDFAEGSLERAIPLLAIPMVLEMVMESIFAICDILFVARLGADAVATVGLTESLLTLLYALAVGLSMPTAAMVARRIGERNPDGAARTAVQSVFLGLILAVVLGVAGALLAPRLLELMGASPSVVATGSGYAALMLGGNAVILFLFLNNAVLRGAGDAAVAMRALWLANGINLVLDPCLIFGLGPFPELGLLGAAVATTIGRGTGVIFQWVYLLRGRGRVAIRREHLRIDPAILLRLLRLSVGGIGQHLIATASWVALVRIVATFGSVALAAYTIAIRLIIFALLPSWGLSNAAATLVGQSLGAGRPERAERAVWLTGLYSMLFLGSVAVVFLVFAHPLVRLFTPDPAIASLAAGGLRVVSFGLIFHAWGMVMMQAFNGAGDTTTPTWINFLCFWLCQIPLGWLLAIVLGIGTYGAFIAVTVSYSLSAVVGLLYFRRGAWKSRVV